MDKPAIKSLPRQENTIFSMQSKIDALTERNSDLEKQLVALKDSRLSDPVQNKTLSVLPNQEDTNFRELLEISPIPMLITSTPGAEILVVNKPLCDVVGFDPKRIIGNDVRKYYSNNSDENGSNQKLDSTGVILQKPIEFTLSDGTKFKALLASRKITFEGLDAVLSAVIDNTDQVNMYQTLEENEARYRLLVENAPEAIILFDVNNRKYIETNRCAADLLGYSTSYLQEAKAESLFPSLQQDKVPSNPLLRRFLRQALAGDVPIFEWQLLNRQGIPLLCEIRLIAYELCHTKYIQCSIVEIGVKRKLEAQISRHQRLQVLGRLTGGIAHDFNNILAIIQGHTELLIEKLSEDSDSTVRLLQKILNSSDRGAELTQKLLAYSRNQPLIPSCIHTNAKMIDINNILTSQVGHQINVDLKLGDNTWDCLADPTRLEGAILNLCLNARDSMPEGGTLTIETSNADLDDEYVTAQLDLVAGEYVQISISDTGGGISPDNIDHVFDPFFTTEDFGQKSGLGLSMVFGFAKQSSGHVSIYSELGHGTVARIYLPRFVPKAETEKAPQIAIPTEERQTVLLVEDDPDIRLLSFNLLQSMNYNVLEAKNADTALQLMRQNPRINMLLTDFILEDGMNGEELAQEARKLSSGLPVLIMTGYTREIMSSHIELDDNTVVLQKPFRKAEFADKILEAKSRAFNASRQG